MAHDWLPEGFENKDVTAPGRVAGRVAVRMEGRRRRAKILRGGMALTALALLLGAAPALWKTLREPLHSPSATAPTDTATSHVGAIAGVGATSRSRTGEPADAPAETALRRQEAAPTDTATSVGATFRSRSLSPDTNPSPPEGGSYNIKGSSEPGLDVSLAKSGHGVELAWTGNPKGEYVIYRCTSPKFDQCSIAGVVKGTQWEDDGKNSSPVVFYRVEPKA